MNLKSGRLENFKQFSQFAALNEFNNDIEMWLVEYKQQFSKGELVGLKRLIRYSAKIPGVCNAKIGTMLKAIHEEYHDNGISRSTFKRMILKAKALGIITVHETERKNGSQSSNLYVFNRFSLGTKTTHEPISGSCQPLNEPPKQEEINHPSKTINLLKTNHQDLNKRIEKVLDYTFTSERVPKPFIQLVKCFFTEAKTIEEYWRMATIAAYRNNREKDTDQVLTVSILSFKQLISRLKSKSKVKKPLAYFYGICDKKFEEMFCEELFEMGF